MAKTSYAFILGSHPDLSIAELYAVVGEKPEARPSPDSVVYQAEIADPVGFLNRLGGTQKAYHLSTTWPLERPGLEQVVAETVRPATSDSKANFAVNCYGRVPSGFQKRVILLAKRLLREQGRSVRFSNLEFRNVSSGKTTHDRLLSRGVEIGVFFEARQVRFGPLIAVQDIGSYAERDFRKPERDMAIGLMPPKLAQMMLNLAGLRPGQSMYDPLCGTGGILVEGVAMGLTCYGSDISPQAVEKAKRNLGWILDKRSLQLKDSAHRVFVKDARTLDSLSFPFDAIVTEGYLGPTLHREPGAERIREIEAELAGIYLPFFRSLTKYLRRRNVPIVACLPFFQLASGPHSCVDLLDSIQGLGYTPARLLPDSDRVSLRYVRSGQKVGREIFRFVLTTTAR